MGQLLSSYFSTSAVLRKSLQLDSKDDLTTIGLLSETFRKNRFAVVNLIPQANKICKACSSLCVYS